MYHIGIDLGGTNIAAGIVDREGRILAKKSVPTHAERPEDEIIADMAHTALSLLDKAGISLGQIRSVGVGSPGGVDSLTGTVISACNLSFHNTPLAKKLGERIPKPIYVANDANCAALAEVRAGAAKGSRHAVMITLGTGVGGGIIINGQIYSGFNSFGGEFGHTIIAADGELCPCGKKGCLEAYASATALVRATRLAAEADRDSLLWKIAEEEGKFSGKTAFRAAKAGDRTGREVIERYVRYLSLGLFNIVKIFQPEVIIVGGGVSHEGQALFDPLTEQVMRMAYREHIPHEKRTKIVAAQLGNDAGIVGAALLGEDA